MKSSEVAEIFRVIFENLGTAVLIFGKLEWGQNDVGNVSIKSTLAQCIMNHICLCIIYLFVKDLDPCLDVHCASFGVCKTYSAHEARCECNEDCPSYQDPVCTANGTTYDNKCLYELSYCKGLDNSTIYHPGSCEGRSFMTQKNIQYATRCYIAFKNMYFKSTKIEGKIQHKK